MAKAMHSKRRLQVSNTRLFHIYASARTKKTYINALLKDTGIAVSQVDESGGRLFQ